MHQEMERTTPNIIIESQLSVTFSLFFLKSLKLQTTGIKEGKMSNVHWELTTCDPGSEDGVLLLPQFIVFSPPAWPGWFLVYT